MFWKFFIRIRVETWSFCRYKRELTELVNYVVEVYFGIRGGTPDKRIPVGLF